MQRACLERGCPRLTTRTRCAFHTRSADKARQHKRGTIYQQGHAARARACIAEQPWCGACGSTRDLTADHVRAGDPTSPLRTLCRSCNSARANRARASVQWPTWHGRELIVLMGAPGSGKSTYAQRFPFVVTTDALRSAERTSSGLLHVGAMDQVYEAAFARVVLHLKRNRQVVLDTPSTNPVTRAHALRVARGYRAKSRLVIMTTSLDVCIQRQAERIDPVPESVVRQMYSASAAQRNAVQGEGWMQVVEVGGT